MTTEARRYTKRDILELECMYAITLIRRRSYETLMAKKEQLKSLYRIFLHAHDEHHATLIDGIDISISEDYLVDVQVDYTRCLRKMNIATDQLKSALPVSRDVNNQQIQFGHVSECEELFEEVSNILYQQPEQVTEVVQQQLHQVAQLQQIKILVHENTVMPIDVHVEQVPILDCHASPRKVPTEPIDIRYRVVHLLGNKTVFTPTVCIDYDEYQVYNESYRYQQTLILNQTVSTTQKHLFIDHRKRLCSFPAITPAEPIPRKPPDRLYY